MGILWRLVIGLLAAWLVPAAAYASGPALRYRVWTIDDGLPQGSVRGIAQTPDGYMWLATFGGLVRFDGVRMLIFSKSDYPEMSSNRCLSLVVDRRGALWVGTEDGGVLQVIGTHVRAFGRSSGLASDNIVAVALDPEGRVWAQTTSGADAFDGDRWYRPAAATFPAASEPAAIGALVDERRPSDPSSPWLWTTGARGDVWLADAGNLRRSERGVWTAFSTPLPAVVQPKPLTLFEDREGNLWIGGDRGLVEASPSPVRAIVPDDPSQRNIYVLAQDSSGRVWIGPQGAPLVWERGVLTSLATAPWWPHDFITSIQPEDGGSVLAGGPGHVYRIWPGQRYEALGDVWKAHVSALLHDRHGRVWAATGAGLLRWTGTAWQPIDGLPQSDVRVLLETHDGSMWAAGYGGLTRLVDGRVAGTWTTRDGLPSDHVRALAEDERGALWIGTYDAGISRFDGGRFVTIRRSDGLFDDGAFAILDGGDGRFYMSSNRGIYSVAKREMTAFADGTARSVTSRVYRADDGMPSSECNGGLQPAGFRAADGTLWFPTQGGIAVLDPKTARGNDTPPVVVIEDVSTDRGTRAAGEPIELAPGERHLEVRYTANTFVRPEGARFRYRLSGFDPGWVEAGNRRFALYGYIPPGRYTLTVAAANSDGVWNDEGVSLSILVRPGWWETLWFRGGLGLVGIVGLAIAYRVRVSALHRRQAEQDRFARRLLASQEAERQRIAHELHDGIGQSLVVIRNRALLGVRDKDGPAPIEQLTEISTAAAEAIEDVRKVAYGLRPYQLDHLGLTRALHALVERTAASSGIALVDEVPQLAGLVRREDEINVYRIVQEAVTNMVRHAKATTGSVAVAVRDREIEIRVEDNGAGFDPAGASIRGGLGLGGIAERARILGGTHQIRSAPGHGTTVVVRVPR